MGRFVVDGMNVIGAQADGWWRDRDGAVRRLLGRLQDAAARSGDEITLVLDGRPLADLPEGEHGGVAVRYSRRSGRNAADDRIVELVDAADDPSVLCVVTSDRDLVDRITRRGAVTEGAHAFLRRLQGLGA
jgi:predicted RNA-binding protein with PIN domain